MAGIRRSNGLVFFIRQILWVGIGSGVAYVAAFKIDYRQYQKYALPLYALAIFSLILVIITATEINGAKRWISLWVFSIQPTEFVKAIMVIVIADFIARKQEDLKNGSFIPPLIYLAPILFLISLEPDFGSIFLIVVTVSLMLFAGEIKLDKKILVLIGFAVLFLIIELFRKGYRRERLAAYTSSIFDIESVLHSASSVLYQVKMSLFALGSGGIFGKGLGKGELKMLYLPEAHTDFIYPIIGEELGFIGAAIVIALFAFIFIKGMRISNACPDVFSKFLAFGITILLTSQALMNISVAIGLLPTKGLVLPFISSGGSAIVVNMAMAGILINLSQYVKKPARRK
jgi:cell division protein FtsW